MMTDIIDKPQDILDDDCVPHFDLQVEELDDVVLSLDEEGDGQLYEHLRMEVDRGQEPVRACSHPAALFGTEHP